MPSTQPQRNDSPTRQLWAHESYRPTALETVLRQAREQKLVGSVALEFSQGTITAVTVKAKIKDPP